MNSTFSKEYFFCVRFRSILNIVLWRCFFANVHFMRTTIVREFDDVSGPFQRIFIFIFARCIPNHIQYPDCIEHYGVRMVCVI